MYRTDALQEGSGERAALGLRQGRAAPMKTLTLLGIVLIVLGVAALAYQGFTYTTRETVIDIGPIKATADREKTIPLPPILGIVAVAGGVALMIAGSRKGLAANAFTRDQKIRRSLKKEFFWSSDLLFRILRSNSQWISGCPFCPGPSSREWSAASPRVFSCARA